MGYARKPRELRPARFTQKASFYDKLIPISELKNKRTPREQFEFFKQRRHEMNQKIKLVLTPMKKERMRLFQVNKVYLSSKGEEGFVKKGNLIVKITIIGGGLCLSGALWLSRYLF